MHTVGTFAPDSIDDARERYGSVATAASTVVRETTRAMGFDREEYGDRVSDDVIDTAHDALFASLLEVHVGTREEYERWLESYDGEVTAVGNENVDNVVWHAGPDEAVAATFHEQEDAAVATLRRQAFGRLYRESL